MRQRITEEALNFDKAFMQELYAVGGTNRKRLRILQSALRKALDTSLTERQREIIQLRFFEEKTCTETAALLGITPSTVSRTMKRAQGHLRESLQFYVDYLNCDMEE